MQYGCGISSRSALGTRWVTKTVRRIAYCPELIAIGGLGHPGKLFSLISGGFEAIWGQKVSRPVATCGNLLAPLVDLSFPF